MHEQGLPSQKNMSLHYHTTTATGTAIRRALLSESVNIRMKQQIKDEQMSDQQSFLVHMPKPVLSAVALLQDWAPHQVSTWLLGTTVCTALSNEGSSKGTANEMNK